MPDPLGPTNPKVSPCFTVNEMSWRMSTTPALPLSERETSERANASVIGAAFERIGSVTYGVIRATRNLGFGLILGVSAAQAETATIAALGDSLTQGYGLAQEDGFVPQLEAWLRARGADVEVINAGVSGDTTAGGLSRVAWTLTPEVDAMIVALGGNDLLRGIDPAVSRANLDGILQAAEAADVEVLLVGLEAPANYGPAYKEAFDGMFGALAQDYGTDYFPRFFEGIMVPEGALAEARARYMQSDGIHPNAEGVAAIVEEMGPAVLELIE